MNVLEVKNLRKHYRTPFLRKKVKAVEDVSFEVKRGEIFGLLGPNGAGKTTTLKTVVGLLKPDGGEIKVFGEPSGLNTKERIGFLPENPYFYRHLTGFELVRFYASLFNKPVKKERIIETIRMVGLEHAMNRKVGTYSKGMMQRIGFAQAIINDPDLIVLDEPMSGLDPIGRKEMKDWIFKLREEGKTILFSSHILPDVEMICDTVGIIFKGRVITTGVLTEILEEEVKYIEVCVEGISYEKIEKYGDVVASGDRLFIRVLNEEDRDRVIEDTLKGGGRVISVIPYRKSLEEYFVEKVGKV